MFCTVSPHGVVAMVSAVKGRDDRKESAPKAARENTAGGTEYRGLSDWDVLTFRSSRGLLFRRRGLYWPAFEEIPWVYHV